MKATAIAFLLLLAAGAALTRPAADGVGAEPHRPVTFSHRYHLVDMEMACADCHGMAAASDSAADRNMPTHDQCGVCHDVETDESCKTCHQDMDLLGLPEEVEPAINFSHKGHLAYEELTCQTCHRGLEKTDYAGEANFPDMTVCSACHDDSRAEMSCDVCHVKTDNLRPEDHHPDWLTGHGSAARLNEESCRACHRESRCEECHQGFRLMEDYLGEFSLRSPDLPSLEGGKGLVKRQVHELNYLYLHPIEAKGRTEDCAVCHEQSNFCAECHLPGGSLSGKPVWHNNRDGEWGAVARAVGSGGGRHAELARRDIERCAACHDIQGQDPTCLACHRDEIPGLGNDLKTHDRGWIEGVGGEGDWHRNRASICFICHTDTRTAGVGFCGYCHQGDR